jgi:hypothetical protein
MEPLEAAGMEEGESGMTVHLTGKNLHGDNNRSYWPATTKALHAAIPPAHLKEGSIFRKRTETVTLHGEHLHDVEEYEACYVSDPQRRIGFLGTHLGESYDIAFQFGQSYFSCLKTAIFFPTLRGRLQRG